MSQHTPDMGAFEDRELEVARTIHGCGCKVVGNGSLPAPLSVQLCPRHAAAPELLMFVESFTQMHRLSHDEFTKRYGYSHGSIEEVAAQLIAKAEGKPVPA